MAGLGAVLGVGQVVYGAFTHDRSDVVVGSLAIVNGVALTWLILRAFRRNSRDPMAGVSVLLPATFGVLSIVLGIATQSWPNIGVGVLIVLNAALVIGETRRRFGKDSGISLFNTTALLEDARTKAAAERNAKTLAKPHVTFGGWDPQSGPATLRMRRDPGGANDRFRLYELWVDGGLAGELLPDGALEFRLLPGEHVVVVRSSWCRSPHVHCVILAGETLALVCESNPNALSDFLEVTIFSQSYIKVRAEPDARLSAATAAQSS